MGVTGMLDSFIIVMRVLWKEVERGFQVRVSI